MCEAHHTAEHIWLFSTKYSLNSSILESHEIILDVKLHKLAESTEVSAVHAGNTISEKRH